MDRRSFIGLLAGSFTLNLLPSGFNYGATKVPHLGKFDPSKIRWGPFYPLMEQAAKVGKALMECVHQCKCGRVFTGLYATVVITDEEVRKNGGSRESMANLLDVKRRNATILLEDLWGRARGGETKHDGCPNDN